MTEDGALRFPCDFPLKIIGERRDDFAQTVLEIVRRHAPDFCADSLQMRASSAGRYLAVTCTLRAVSRAQLDGLYRELSAHPAVRMTL